eukprot:CAMPEP_0198282992 /NCGR_PEP_ID=MMETSP1449-20131203/2686_1 /TAXON_ID=420275 /ORGANISM="Attheya septentrionalis, Strain CCMP2084" /LENGTH=319 /DNA_ID=CAMNT_0043979439 /DNA_START=198 /DNA_END=1158 /DNA_ORIENTATION=+
MRMLLVIPLCLMALLEPGYAREIHRFQAPSRAALRSLRHAMHQSSPSSLYALSGIPPTSSPRAGNIYTCSAEKGVPVSSRTGKSVAGSWKIRPYSMARSMGQGRGQSSLSGKLIFLNVACYILQTMNPAVTKFGAKVSEAILSGREPHRLLTPIFLHGGIAHLMTNSYSLQNIGPEVERLFGGGRFMATYMVSGITGNLLSAIKSPNPAVGASGAIFGIAGAYFVFLQRNRDYLGREGDQQLNSVAQMIIMNVVVGSISPMIDNWGHIGGALGGAAMAYVFGPRIMVAQLPSGQRIMVDKPIADYRDQLKLFLKRLAME